MDLPGHVLIVGFGKSGRAVSTFCAARNVPCTVVDDAPEEPSKWLCERGASPAISGLECVQRFEELTSPATLCVVSPGIYPDNPVLLSCERCGREIINEVEFALRFAMPFVPKMIAVTGTNGKTTVVELITHLLSSSGQTAKAVGNIGLPFLEALMQPVWPEWFVVELSSFQLERISQQVFSFGCWLNFSQNHLDWHKSLMNYQKAKERIGSLIRPGGTLLLHESIGLSAPLSVNVLRYGRQLTNEVYTDGFRIFWSGQECGKVPKSVSWNHDVDNFLAAWTLARMANVPPDVIEKSSSSFSKPPHRISFVAEVKGVTYWDDSKGTTVAATEAAVAAVPGPIVLIAGGESKGACFMPWRKTLPGKVALMVTIGQAKKNIQEAVEGAIPVRAVQTLREAVEVASTSCSPPFSVLLSPGCASFDMFHDYKDRGRQFQEIVRGL